MREEVARAQDRVLMRAKQNLLEHGEVRGLFVVVQEVGEFLLLVPPDLNPMDLAPAIEPLARKQGIGLLLVTEMWWRSLETESVDEEASPAAVLDSIQDELPVRDNPDREEAVAVIACDDSGEVLMKLQPFGRKDGQPEFGERELVEFSPSYSRLDPWKYKRPQEKELRA